MTKLDDPGGDDSDLFGMTLDYYSGDYVRYNRFSQLGSNQRVAVDQFNGNIKGITWNTKQGTTVESPLQYLYAYDRNNWLKSAQFIERDKKYPSIPSNLVLEKPEKTKTVIKASESITLKPGFTATANSSYSLRLVVSDPKSDYKVSNITYDANGNIQTLMRNKDSENDNNRMDDLTYVYDTHKPNRLRQVIDAVTVETNANDIKTQPKYNYYYNNIGQLYYNRQEGLFYAYNAAGLVTDVRKNGVLLVRFNYNDRGHRVKKLSYVKGKVQTTTHYVRDVAGSVMAIYENKTLTEHPIYGASRLGVYKRKSKTSLYQLTDHLGNVRAVIAKKGSNAAALVAKTDYYPFGMPMPNRNVEGDYRYKYQGQEKDKETGMEAFEARLWDSRIGRWLTVDPAGEFYSPYLGMGNNPISTIDPDGRCTRCPKNANKGDTFNHKDYDNPLAFDGVNWLDSGGNLALDGVDVVANSTMKAYWSDVNALAINLNKQIDLETGKSASIRMLGELEKEVAQMSLINQYNGPTVIAGGGAMDLIGGRGAFKLLSRIGKLKSISLPSLRKVTINMEHILSGHIKNGSRVSSAKTLFESNLTANQINSMIKTAYSNAKILKTQGDRVKLVGEATNGTIIEMWLNKATKTIETAYPKF